MGSTSSVGAPTHQALICANRRAALCREEHADYLLRERVYPIIERMQTECPQGSEAWETLRRLLDELAGGGVG